MLTLISPILKEGGSIPSEYTCDGKNKNPPLSWSGAPAGTKSFVLLMDDPDIPPEVKHNLEIEVFDHWVLFNIPPEVTEISAGTVPEGAIVGKTSSGKNAYAGPCPPDSEHRYFWRLYALDTMLELGGRSTRAQVDEAMEGHILATATLLSRYERANP